MAKKKKPLTEKDIPDWLNPTERQIAKMFMHLDPLWENQYTNKISVIKYGQEVVPRLHLLIQLNTFKALSERLIYNPEYDKTFQEWKNGCKEYWLDELKSLRNPFRHPITGEPCVTQYDEDGTRRIKDWNYYSSNYASNFDILFEANYYDELVILEELEPHLFFVNPVYLHDVRKNYSSLFNDSVMVYCRNCKSGWEYWSRHFGGSSDNDKELDKDYPKELGTKGKEGTLVIRNDGLVFCPVCGKGVLN